MARKKQRNALLQSNLDYIRKSGRSVQALLFVAAFGVIGGGGWLAFGASAADGVLAKGSCILVNSTTGVGVGGGVPAKVVATFDDTAGGNGAKLRNVRITLPVGNLFNPGTYATGYSTGIDVYGDGTSAYTQEVKLPFYLVSGKTYEAPGASNLTHVARIKQNIYVKLDSKNFASCTASNITPY